MMDPASPVTPAGGDLAGRRALVTGGTRGIGRAITLALARAGAQVLTCARTGGDEAAALERELKELGADAPVVVADVTDPADAGRLADECRARLGGLDVLVNNAGRDGDGPLAELTEQAWGDLLDADLTSVYLVTRACLPLLGPGASVINIGSGLALRGRPGRTHYAAAKAGVLGLSRTLCKELGPSGIRVNTITPGIIDTDPDRPHPMAGPIRHMAALGRLGTPDDVAAAAAFLASPASGYVSGAVLPVDGGM
jgi:3-oxoacyl-[acyl-carrier protein] reductase